MRYARTIAVVAAVLSSFTAAAQGQLPTWEQVFPSTTDLILVTGPDNLIAHSGSLIYRSTDSGTTWNQAGTFAEEPTILRLDSQGQIYAGTWDSGLYRSSDEGSTWSRISPVMRIWDVAVNSHGDIFLATEGEKVLRSTDGGASWMSIGSNQMGPYIWSIHVDAQDRVVAGAQGEGIFRSTDNGETWSQLLPGFVVNAITSDASGTMYAGMDDDGVYRSTDDGMTWTQTSLVDLAETGQMSINRPITTDESGGVFVTGVIFGPGFRYAAFYSTDRGVTWSEYQPHPAPGAIPQIAVDSHGSVFVATASGIFRMQRASSAVDDAVDRRGALLLSGAAPNPVHRECLFQVIVPVAGLLSFRIVNSLGVEVARLYDGEIAAGMHRFEWDASGVSDGVYFCRVGDGRSDDVRKIVVSNGR